MNFEVFLHPIYSLDSGPSNLHVWRSLKVTMNQRKLKQGEDSSSVPVTSFTNFE